MPKHEHFEELCALALIGELPAEAQIELYSHVRVCEECRSATREYLDVLQHLPIETAPLSDHEMATIQETAGAESFISRAQQEGVVFSRDAVESSKPGRRAWHFWSRPLLVLRPGVVATAAVLSIVLWFGMHRKDLGAAPSRQLALASNPQETALPDRQIAFELSRANEQLAGMKAQVLLLRNEVDSLRRERNASDDRLNDEHQIEAGLRAKIQQEESTLLQAASSTEKAQTERDQAIASLIGQQTQIQALQTELNSAHADVEQEKELNSAARDVRELMGARKLHIIDVYDADSNAGSEKSFGRVIYTEGKSLIFYAFDLDGKRRGRKVSFQAWGERDGQHQEARNLGVFYIDDEIQKRWVLKVNEAAKLRAIDTVFVTVEAHGDASKPSGQRFLQAYLGSRPNHP